MSVTVSVIVPNYNHASFLRERLDSIYNQTFKDFEVILLDDASTDDSVTILQEYATRPNTRLIINNGNSGSPFVQWKRGVDCANGEYIWLAESDDYADPQFLQRQLRALSEHPDAVLAYCQSTYVDSSGNPLDHQVADYYYEPERYKSSFVNDGDSEIENFLKYQNTVPNASAVLFRRDVASKVDIPLGLRYCGDWLFWIRMLRYGEICFDALACNYFRWHVDTSRELKSPEEECARILEFLMCFKEADRGGDILQNDRGREKFYSIKFLLYELLLDHEVVKKYIQKLGAFDSRFPAIILEDLFYASCKSGDTAKVKNVMRLLLKFYPKFYLDGGWVKWLTRLQKSKS